MTARVLITGGQGFIGRVLAAASFQNGLAVRVSTRQKFDCAETPWEQVTVEGLGATTNWSGALQGVITVVHCAGRAHVLRDIAADPLSAFRKVNVEGTLNLARQAAEAGVRRFVFISSVGVNGVNTKKGQVFSESSKPNPHNAYALSKWEAEQGLKEIARTTGMEVVILRPPLVYGPNAPGNFGSLMRAVQKGWPLPLGAIHNQRSLVGLDNLVDFIMTCISHPQAANQTFLISDGQDLSTAELVRGLAEAAGVTARLLPVPVWACEMAGRLTGKADAVQRLCGNLQIDSRKARDLLGWQPKVSVPEGLRRAVLGMTKP